MTVSAREISSPHLCIIVSAVVERDHKPVFDNTKEVRYGAIEFNGKRMSQILPS